MKRRPNIFLVPYLSVVECFSTAVPFAIKATVYLMYPSCIRSTYQLLDHHKGCSCSSCIVCVSTKDTSFRRVSLIRTAKPIGWILPVCNKTVFRLNSDECIKRRHCLGSRSQPRFMNNPSMKVQKKGFTLCKEIFHAFLKIATNRHFIPGDFKPIFAVSINVSLLFMRNWSPLPG